MNDRTTVYSTYYNPIEANIVRARLEDGGFSCFLADENISTINPLYNQAIGGVRLIVFERDIEDINKFLGEDTHFDHDNIQENENLNNENIACPSCGSNNVSYGQATKKRFSWWVTTLSLLLFTYPFKVNKCYHCYTCGYEFHDK